MVEQAPSHGSTSDRVSPALVMCIRAAIAAADGALPFDEFMAMALYEPGIGYYTREDRLRVGREGDFITSVSVGRCFGMLLARHLAPKIEAMAESGAGELSVVEVGAEGGQLAADVMGELAKVLPANVYERVGYIAVEPFEAKRAVLAESLSSQGVARARIVGGWGEISGLRGVLIANEVLDAMPVKRFRLREGKWREVCVGEREGNLVELERNVVGSSTWPSTDLGEGFTFERCPGVAPWFAELAGAFDELHACIIDYGLEHSADFLDPGRRDGTLRAYRNHQLIEDPLAVPGTVDLTAHVDFESAAKGASAAGLEFISLTDQHRFLVNAARGWLLEIEQRGVAPDAETAKLLRQFQSLSHPAAMGMAFKVLEAGK